MHTFVGRIVNDGSLPFADIYVDRRGGPWFRNLILTQTSSEIKVVR